MIDKTFSTLLLRAGISVLTVLVFSTAKVPVVQAKASMSGLGIVDKSFTIKLKPGTTKPKSVTVPNKNKTLTLEANITTSYSGGFKSVSVVYGPWTSSGSSYTYNRVYNPHKASDAYCGRWKGTFQPPSGGSGGGGRSRPPPGYGKAYAHAKGSLYIKPATANVPFKKGEDEHYKAFRNGPPALSDSVITWEIKPRSSMSINDSTGKAKVDTKDASNAASYTVEATKGTGPGASTATATFNTVVVKSLSAKGKTSTEGNVKTIYAAKDETVEFKATPEHASVFPSGEPTWQATDATITTDNGRFAEIKFPNVSTSGNPATVKAKCGDDDEWKEMEVIVGEADLKLTNHFASNGSTYKIDTGTAEFEADVTPTSLTVSTFEWNFGDGDTSTSSGNTIQHVYPHLDTFSATVEIGTSTGDTIESDPIDVELDYSNVYPVTFRAGSSLNFPTVQGWYNNRVSRLMPRDGVNKTEYELLSEINSPDYEPELHQHPICNGSVWSDPLFTPPDSSVYPEPPPPSPPITSTSSQPETSDDGDGTDTPSTSIKDLKDSVQVVGDYLFTQKNALQNVKSCESDFNTVDSKYSTMMTKWTILSNELTDVKNAVSDPTASDTEQKQAFEDFNTALKELNNATKDFAQESRNLINTMNNKAEKLPIPRKMADYLKQNAGKVDTALAKIVDVQSEINSAYSSIDAAKGAYEDIADAYEEMYKNAFQDDANKFDKLLPADQYPGSWAADWIDDNYDWNDPEERKYFYARYMQLPYDDRYDLMWKWFSEHNDGSESYFTPIVFANADLVGWTQVKVGWLGANFALSKLFPTYGKIHDAMEALKDVEYILDPRNKMD